MAIFYLRTSIVRASSGKSAVASSAYITAQTLYSERLKRTFSYSDKEEAAYSEIMFCENCPDKLRDRSALWNAVEAHENKVNSRFARSFVVALPNVWTKEECIEYSREFVQKAFVDKGACADWAVHLKDGNKHIHVQTTIRAFNKNGTWAQSEKKEFVLDENGEKIPELDENGEQKVRVRERNGKTYTERIWKRRTVQRNPWDSRQFLKDVKKDWAETANKYLTIEEQIDYRSYRERDLNRVPMLHEGTAAREALERGEVFDVVKENQERRSLNEELSRLEKLIDEARKKIEQFKDRFRRWKEMFYEQGRSSFYSRTTAVGFTGDRDAARVDIISPRRDRVTQQLQEIEKKKEELENKIESKQQRRKR